VRPICKLSIQDQASDREPRGASVWITIAPESELAYDSLSWLHNFFLFLSMDGALEITPISEFSAM
jgi:hypothetical protein